MISDEQRESTQPEDNEPLVVAIVDINARGKRQQRGCLITFALWLGALMVVFKLESPMERERWAWLVGAAWFVLILIAPAVGILQAVELKDYLDWKGRRSASTMGFRFLIILGSWLLAAVAGGVGLLAMAASLDKSTSSVLQSAIGSVASLGLILLALFLVMLPFRRPSGPTEEETRKWRAVHETRLAHPDFEGIERMAGVKLPALYRTLLVEGLEWRDRFWTLHPKGLEDDEEAYDVVGIVPAHLDALRRDGDSQQPYLAFANGEFCEYWLQLGPEDPPVFSRSTEANAGAEERFTRVCDRLSEFLSWPKEEV